MDEAMNLPGSRQMGLAKRLLEQYDWHRFEPRPNWAEYASGDDAPQSYGPFAMGIPADVRIIYVPEPRTVRVLQIEPNLRYRASAFDPRKRKVDRHWRRRGGQERRMVGEQTTGHFDG
jgi:hypothetical protein